MIGGKQELKIHSSLDSLNEVVALVEEIGDIYNINNTYFGNILVSLTEAVKNAIVHGNQNNPEKMVWITFEPGPQGLGFSVKDEGEGFDFSQIPDPTEEEAPSKKGLYLIKSLADQIEFLDKGSLVKFVFSISSINYQLSVDRRRLLSEYFASSEKKVETNQNSGQ